MEIKGCFSCYGSTARLKQKFKECTNFKRVLRPNSCSKESWLKIYENTKDKKKKSKSAKCKIAAHLRYTSQGFSYKCGPKGLKGIRDQFVSFLPFHFHLT